MISHIINSKSTISLICAIIYLGLPLTSSAQFIDLNLEIEPEVVAKSEQALSFGILATNSGRHTVPLGDINMGIFSITALESQELLVTLEKPTSLSHKNPAIKQYIPIQLFVRYGFSHDNYRDSYALNESINSIIVEEDPGLGPWNTLYMFIFGAVDITNVPNGIYTGQLVLNVEYL